MVRDPRIYQIAVLSLLLAYGVAFLDFGVGPGRAIATLAAALLTQYACSRIWKLPVFDPRSAFTSGMSLCLLLRTNLLWVAIAAAVATIASKFIFRRNGKHIFNPSNFGLIAAMAFTGNAWISAGQWGSVAFFAFLVACLGGFVIHRSSRSDVTWAFITAYVSILFGRALWLGDPFAIPLHQLQNGAFLLFAFFMISDPKTTPDSRAGRVLFAALVAVGATFIQFGLYRTNGLLWSLVLFSMTVPVIDWLFPGKKYAWKQAGEARRLPHQRATQGATE